MARSRNIKPGFFQNDVLAEKPALTRILFQGLWSIADREGRLEDRVKKIKAACLPFDDVDIDAALNDLASSSDPFIIRYTVAERKYIQVVNWHRHQSPHVREPESNIPPVPAEHHTSTSLVCVEPVEASNGIRNQESGISKGGVGETASGRFTPPTVDEVAAYCASRGNKVDAAKFCDFYEAKGWKIGKNSMKDWKASVRTWETNESGARGSPSRPGFNMAGTVFKPNTETRNEI